MRVPFIQRSILVNVPLSAPGTAAIRHLYDILPADREIVLAALKGDGGALEYAAKSLRADREIVLKAVKQDGDALKYAAKSLKADREIVLAAVKEYGHALEFGAKFLRADREIVLAAMKQDGSALEYADKALLADREFVLAAVKHHGRALEYVDKALRADREIVLAAVQQESGALRYASEELRQDEELKKARKKKVTKKRITKKIGKYDPEQNETDYIVSVLEKIIDDHLDHFKKSNEFKVRPGYSYDKFYLDRVQGSFDQSLNGLIHHIMFQDGIYKELLTDEQYESCKKVVEEEPGSIWGLICWML